MRVLSGSYFGCNSLALLTLQNIRSIQESENLNPMLYYEKSEVYITGFVLLKSQHNIIYLTWNTLNNFSHSINQSNILVCFFMRRENYDFV
jgi:hypothetical protein